MSVQTAVSQRPQSQQKANDGKWIILACLYLAMAACEPMHPQWMTGWQKRDGKYYCRAREEQDGSVCQWCVCRSMES